MSLFWLFFAAWLWSTVTFDKIRQASKQPDFEDEWMAANVAVTVTVTAISLYAVCYPTVSFIIAIVKLILEFT